MKLTDLLASRTGAASARETAPATLSTLITTLKRDVEQTPNAPPSLTPEQQAVQARANALFVADHLVPGECPQTFADLWAAFRADFGPTGAIEEELVRHLAAAALGLRRLDRIEGRMWQANQRMSRRQFGPERTFDTHAGISVLLSRACHALSPDHVARLDQYRKIFGRRWADALKQLLQYRKATGRKPAALPKEMPFEKHAEHAPLPSLHVALQEEETQPPSLHDSLGALA